MVSLREILFFCQFKLKICLFTYTDSANLSMERETTHIYACWKFVT